MVIERYSHVMHITSNVTGQLADDRDAFDALRACLPAGTVSGAPKVRAMEIIDELEPHRRGPYAGAVGYIDFAGNMDTCIALRTIVVQDDTAYVQAGAGIVADSVPGERISKKRSTKPAGCSRRSRLRRNGQEQHKPKRCGDTLWCAIYFEYGNRLSTFGRISTRIGAIGSAASLQHGGLSGDD